MENVSSNQQELLQGHTNYIKSIAVSKDGAYIASGETTEIGFKVNFFTDKPDRAIKGYRKDGNLSIALTGYTTSCFVLLRRDYHLLFFDSVGSDLMVSLLYNSRLGFLLVCNLKFTRLL